MSSGTQVNMGAARGMLSAVTPQIVNQGSGPTNHLSERQQELDLLWRHYRCTNYDSRQYDWDGGENHGKVERELVATSGVLPGGFYDAGQTAPLKFRKPSAPYYLGKVIVDRFTGLLFSERRHPMIRVPGDLKTEHWLQQFAKATRLWQRMNLARTYGGAMGSVGMGFKFVRGRPIVEVHDPRWCTPEFLDRNELIVDRIEKLYQYPEQMRDPATGEWITGWFWYRRVIDDTSDTVWPKVAVDDDQEPDWSRERFTTVEHKLGFCPVVWIQNTEVQDSIDGDPDCHGSFDTIEEMDALIAQANRGTKANCDPTLVITTDDELDDEIQKGSDNSLRMSSGSNASYLELEGSGPRAAMEQAKELSAQTLRSVRCVLDDNFSGPARTEEEVEQNYSNMLERADTFREQYGELGIKRLLEMVLIAAHGLSAPTREPDAEGVVKLVQQKIYLPLDKDGVVPVLGDVMHVELKWPPYYEPSLDRVSKAVEAAKGALDAGLIEEEHAVRFVASFFNIEDPDALLKKWKLDAEKSAAAEAATAAAAAGEGEEGEAGPAAVQDTALNGAQWGTAVDIAERVAQGTLPKETGANLLNLGIPTVSIPRAMQILGAVGTPDFKPPTDDPAAAFTKPVAPKKEI